MKINVKTLEAIGIDIARMVKDYSRAPNREGLLDPTLYAYLRASGRTVQRQYHAHLPGAMRPPRIDFRVKGPNAVLIELAVRPPSGGTQLYGSQNATELRKLCRFNNASAKLRCLLLVDLSPYPIGKQSLKKSYDQLHAGKGKFSRFPVKVVYAHSTGGFSFKWSPYKTI